MLSSWPDIGLWSLLLAAVAVFVAAIVQSTMGMGFGQLAAPALLLIDPRFVPAAVIMMGMMVSTTGLWRNRRDADRREMLFALGGRLVGALAAGALVATAISMPAFPLVFAALLLLAIAISLADWRLRLTPVTLFLAGGVSGFMGTVTSIGAPPMGLVYQHHPGPHVRGTLNGFFAVGTMISLLALGLFGQLGVRDLLLALSLLPALLGGIWVSRYLTDFADRRFRSLVLWACAVSAVAIIFKAII